ARAHLEDVGELAGVLHLEADGARRDQRRFRERDGGLVGTADGDADDARRRTVRRVRADADRRGEKNEEPKRADPPAFVHPLHVSPPSSPRVSRKATTPQEWSHSIMRLHTGFVVAVASVVLAGGSAGAARVPTFADAGRQATATLLGVWYAGAGHWHECTAPDCNTGNI